MRILREIKIVPRKGKRAESGLDYNSVDQNRHSENYNSKLLGKNICYTH